MNNEKGQETASNNISETTIPEQKSFTTHVIQIISEGEFDFSRIKTTVNDLGKLVQETRSEKVVFSILRSFQEMKDSDNWKRYCFLSTIENCLTRVDTNENDPLDLLLIKIMRNGSFDSDIITKFLCTEKKLDLSNSVCILECLKNVNDFGLFQVFEGLVKIGRQDIINQICKESNEINGFKERYLKM
jgi:hypothetical protein